MKVKAFPHAKQRKLSGLGPKCCVVLRKPLISKAKISKKKKKQSFNLLGSIMIILCSNGGGGSCGLMSPDLNWAHQGKKRWQIVLHPSCLVPTVQDCGGNGFSAVVWG